MTTGIDELEFRYAFARTMRAFREEKRLTQQEMAAKMGKTQACVSYWEHGNRMPSLLEFLEFGEAFGVNVADFIKQIKKNVPKS